MAQYRVAAVSILLACAFGCDTQKIEYRTRPAWHNSMGSNLPSESTHQDGTIIKFSNSKKPTSEAFDQYLESITLIEKDEVTGETTLRAILPTHIFTQALTCLRDRDWDLLFNQIISTQTQSYYKSRHDELLEYKTFFEDNREDIAKILQRMVRGSNSGDVLVSKSNGFIVFELSNRVGVDYKYNTVILAQEEQFLKLHSIH